jgi:AcrR family transcriptional regulator
MSVTPTRDRRAERREATRAEILDAAWQLAREEGLAGLSLRDLGRRVGMRAQSLYSYFDSKHAIYDALFAEGYRELLDRFEELARGGSEGDADERFRENARVILDFALEDLARYQLLFQRTIPGFEPSPESYALAVRVLDISKEIMAAAGVHDPRDVDLLTAVVGGLGAQQLANEPGGDRWARLLDDAVDMFLQYVRNPDRRQHP